MIQPLLCTIILCKDTKMESRQRERWNPFVYLSFSLRPYYAARGSFWRSPVLQCMQFLRWLCWDPYWLLVAGHSLKLGGRGHCVNIFRSHLFPFWLLGKSSRNEAAASWLVTKLSAFFLMGSFLLLGLYPWIVENWWSIMQEKWMRLSVIHIFKVTLLSWLYAKNEEKGKPISH